MLTAQMRRKAMRLTELAPLVLQSPRKIRGVLRRLHPGILVVLDQPWIRDLNIDVVLDIGANTGQFAHVAHHVFPQAKIISFEPLPDCAEAIRHRMRGVSGFTVFATAVGNVDGQIRIHRSASSPSSSILAMTEAHTDAFPWTANSTDFEVPIRPLDSFLPQLALTGTVLLKIDVQGYGLEVLRGARQVLTQVDIVFIETSFVPLYAGEPTFDAIYSHMTEAGFEFHGLLDQLAHPVTRQLLQGDAIFRRAS